MLLCISGYLEDGTHLSCNYEISEICITKKLQKFKLIKGKLYYKEQIQDESDHDRLVVKRSKVDRIVLERHLTPGSHRGRDATVRRESKRYFWPIFCKEIKEEVHIDS